MIKYSILLSLSKLSSKMYTLGFIHIAEDIDEILYDFIEGFDEENQESDDLSAIINSVGLRGDTKPEEPMGGFTLEPFFFDKGDIC